MNVRRHISHEVTIVGNHYYNERDNPNPNPLVRMRNGMGLPILKETPRKGKGREGKGREGKGGNFIGGREWMGRKGDGWKWGISYPL